MSDAFGAQMNNATLTNANVTGASFLEVYVDRSKPVETLISITPSLTGLSCSGAEFTGATFAGAKLVPNSR